MGYERLAICHGVLMTWNPLQMIFPLEGIQINLLTFKDHILHTAKHAPLYVGSTLITTCLFPDVCITPMNIRN